MLPVFTVLKKLNFPLFVILEKIFSLGDQRAAGLRRFCRV
jgi:hypothetical protein